MKFKKNIYFFIIALFLFSQSGYAENNFSKTNIVKKVNNLFYEGLASYINRDFKQATQYWQKALLLLPENKKIQIYFEKAYNKFTKMEKYFYAGLGNFNNKKYRTAIKDFKKTLAINPRHKKALYYLKLCYEMLKVHLKIVDSPVKGSKEIGDIELTTDSSVKLYAVGYDGAGDFVGAVPVKWSVNGSLDAIDNTNFSAELLYSPKTFNTEGKIKITLNNCYPDETGIIKVKKGRLAKIKVFSLPNGGGKEILSLKLTTDSNIVLYAAGFDKNGKYIGDITANWDFQINEFKLNKNNTKNFKLFSTKIGKGKLIITAKNNVKTVLSNIVITPGKLKYIQIEDSPEGNTQPVQDLILSTDDTKIFYAFGYDNFFNLIGPIKVNWKTTGDLPEIISANNEKIFFKSEYPGVSGKIIISKKGVPDSATGVIKIVPGKTEYILITTNYKPYFKKLNQVKIQAGKKFKLFSAGFNSGKKFNKLMNVFWKIEGKTNKVLANKYEAVFTNANINLNINITLPIGDEKLTDNVKIIILPGEINNLVISDSKKNLSNTTAYTLVADTSKKFYAFFIDKFGNFIKYANVKWKLKNLSGNLSNTNSYSTLFYPNMPGKGILSAEIIFTNNIKFRKNISIKVIPGKPEGVAFYVNNNFITNNGSVSNFIFSKNILQSLLIDKHRNIIRTINGNWNINCGERNILNFTNKSIVRFSFTNKISNAVIKFIPIENTNFKGELYFRTVYPEISFVRVVDFTNNKIVTNISLKFKDKIKLKAVAMASNKKILFSPDGIWKTSLNKNKLLYNKGLTNVLIGVKSDSEEKLIFTNKLVGRQIVADIKVLKPEIMVLSSSNIVTSRKVIIYDIYIGDTLGKIVSKIFLLPYKWKYVYPYVKAIAAYNKIKNVNLIFPKQTLYVPYFTVEETTTKQDLAEKIFGDRQKSDLIINYKKNYTNKINPGDKIIIKNLKFISTGKSDVFIKTKRVIK